LQGGGEAEGDSGTEGSRQGEKEDARVQPGDDVDLQSRGHIRGDQSGQKGTDDLAQAHGRYTAREMRAQVDNPAFDNSAMDGYALRAADLVAADFILPLLGECRCGDAPQKLSADAKKSKM